MISAKPFEITTISDNAGFTLMDVIIAAAVVDIVE